MTDIVIIVILAVLILVGIASSIKHFKGEGGCCGGSSTTKQKKKRLTGQKIGEMVVLIEGMNCENCKNRVERTINKMDGVVCEVLLKKNTAVISYSTPIEADVIKQAIEELDFKVKEIMTR